MAKFWQSPSHGCEPLGLSAWHEVHTWLPIQSTPGPETQHVGQAKTKQKVASVAHPAHPPPWNSACRSSKNSYRGVGIWWLAVQWAMLSGRCVVFGSQGEAGVSRSLARPPCGTEPDVSGSLSTLMLVQVLCPGPGSGLAGELQMLLWMIPAR
eukprot:1161659-Pelagomonas_calceolata.AAC.8